MDTPSSSTHSYLADESYNLLSKQLRSIALQNYRRRTSDIQQKLQRIRLEVFAGFMRQVEFCLSQQNCRLGILARKEATEIINIELESRADVLELRSAKKMCDSTLEKASESAQRLSRALAEMSMC
jgi:hypothetical protein